MKPNVTSTGFMRVVFRSNKDKRVQGGARCLVECSNNSSENKFFFGIFSYFSPASRSLEVLTGLLDQLEEEELAAEAEEQSFAENGE